MDISYIVPKILRKILNPAAINKSRLDRTAKVDIGSIVNCSSMGKYSYIGEYTSVIYTTVGSFTSISSFCAIGGGSHPIDWVAMSPVYNNTKGLMKARFVNKEYNPFKTTSIGNDVWIGTHSIIKGGVTIADGAVIGMGSIVTHDVGPYEIWGGNPARMIKKRFDDNTIAKLLEISWWKLDDDVIRKIAQYVDDVPQFIEFVQKECVVGQIK